MPKTDKPKIIAIIFDFDGVIHDTFELSHNIMKKVLNRENMSREEYKDFFNGNFYEHKELASLTSNNFFNLQDEEFKKMKIKNYIKKTLMKLGESRSLFIVSSNMEAILNSYFANNNMAHIFKEILAMESHKSKTAKFKLIMEKYGLNKKNCLFVTDTLGDILEANKIGLKTIAVDYGFHERERLAKGNPLKIISDFRELLPAINNL